MDFLNVILNVISPIFIVVGIAYLIGKRFNPDTKALSSIMVYLFTPSLVFATFAKMTLSSDELFGLAGVVTGVAVTMAILGVLIARWQGWQPEVSGAYVVCVVMVNAANYGVPVNQFAFGEAGAARALIYYAIVVVVGNAFGIYFASRGSVSARQAFQNVLSVPLTYAALAGLAVNAGIFTLPLPITRAISDIAAQGAIPTMLALLGIKLAQTSVKGRLRPIFWATLQRLVIAPFIALPLALLFGLQGVTFQVAIVQSSMPTAVLANALVAEFGSDAELTSAVTVVTTLCSIVTLSIIIALVS
jgi:hypothetical protein